MATLDSMLVGVFRRSELVNVLGSRLRIAFDVVRREPHCEFIRLHGVFLDSHALRDAREHVLRMLEPLIEGRLQVAVSLRESADTIKVVPFVPGDCDQIDGWLPLLHSDAPTAAKAA